jgi:hypothetical protein
MSLPEQTTWRVELNITEAWQKLAGVPVKVGRAGIVPVFDGEWRFFRTTPIWPYVENAADPAKVEKVRQDVLELLAHFDQTLPELEKLGIRVKGLLNKPIKTQADVKQWAEGFFNTGPTTPYPQHVQDALALAYDDFKIQVIGGRHPVFVLPVAPKEANVRQTVDFTVPGSKVRYGPRHAYTKAAFSLQAPGGSQRATEASRRQQARDVLNGAVRGRGRPRKDGLMPGSREAMAADKKRQRDLERKRIRKTQPKPEGELATITELPPPKRHSLVRVGKTADGVGS